MADFESAHGDLLQAKVEALVNPVNCAGVMGKGLALQFKRAFPDNFKTYALACKMRTLVPGTLCIHDRSEDVTPRYVINFPTKRHWRDASRAEDIDQGLVALAADIARLGIRSIAVPPLGCGLGGLDWKVVRPLIMQTLCALPGVKVLLYEPTGGGR